MKERAHEEKERSLLAESGKQKKILGNVSNALGYSPYKLMVNKVSKKFHIDCVTTIDVVTRVSAKMKRRLKKYSAMAMDRMVCM